MTSIAADVRDALAEHADPVRAVAMAAYMKDRFLFFGIPSPERRRISRRVIGRWKAADASELGQFSRWLWEQPERELQYVAADELRRQHGLVDIELLEELILTKSWWDSVDALANTVGLVVRRDTEGATAMERWIVDTNMWLVRAAIIHQLGHRSEIDEDRLFRFCALQAGHPDFFVRKAIGWALRDHAYRRPDAVGAFVAAHSELSPLSVREALKHLGQS
jgi:3-methyladenine DNA glycosylase AlkD